MAEKRKLTCLTLEIKREILAEVDRKILSRGDICKKYGIPKSTLSTFIKNRERIENISDGCQPDRKKHRVVKFSSIEQALFIWFRQARSMSLPISGPILMMKAEEIGEEMGINFTGNTGWLDRFKKRYGIVQQTVSGESSSVKTEKLTDWRANILLELLQNYNPKDIYSADETGLLYRMLPSQTVDLKGEKCSSGKMAKNRLTVLVAANMDGTDKLPLLVVGKFQGPHCFKNCRYLPLQYHANTKSWMTRTIFESWVRSLDEKFKYEGRRVALVIDNCPAHPDIKDLEAITIARLPPNTMSVLQPCDQGIIASLKQNYRKMILHKLMVHTDEGKDVGQFEPSILDAMYDLKAAWNKVTSTTIANSFKHAGFVSHLTLAAEIVPVSPPSPPIKEEYGIFETIACEFLPPGVTLQDYFSADDGVHTARELTTKEIASTVLNSREEEEEDDAPENIDTTPSSAEARNAVHILRRYIQATTWSKADDYINCLGILPVNQSSQDFVWSHRVEQVRELHRAIILLAPESLDSAQENKILKMKLLEEGVLPLKYKFADVDSENKYFLAIAQSMKGLVNTEADLFWLSTRFYRLIVHSVYGSLSQFPEYTMQCLRREEQGQKLYSHLRDHQVINELPLMDWFHTCFANVLPEPSLERIWDRVIGGSVNILIYVAVAILLVLRRPLLAMQSTEDMVSYLKQIPEDCGDRIVNEALDLLHKNAGQLPNKADSPANENGRNSAKSLTDSGRQSLKLSRRGSLENCTTPGDKGVRCITDSKSVTVEIARKSPGGNDKGGV